jgi:MFS family permease
MSRTPRFAATFHSLRHPNYRLFWGGQLFSLTGNWIQGLAEGYLIYQVTGSAFALGVIGFVSLLPVVPISIAGSALIDRFSKRRLLFLTQIALALNALGWAFVAGRSDVQLWQLVALSFFEGAVASLDLPTRQAFLPELVGHADLPNCIALNTFLFNGARMVGPILAGVLIARFGASLCFAINAATFLPFLVGLAAMRQLYRPAPGAYVPSRPGSPSVGVLRGLDYVRRTPVLLWLIALMSVSHLLLLPYLTLLPAIATKVLFSGPIGLGLLGTSVGLGALLGSLWLANLQPASLPAWLIRALYALALGIVVLVAQHLVALAMVVAIVIGVSTTLMQTIFNTLVQLHVRDDMRGRTLSVHLMLQVGMGRVGALGAGLLTDIVSIRLALASAAALSLLVTTGALRFQPAELRGDPTEASVPLKEVCKV